MAVFITYDDVKSDVIGHRYVGNGEHAPIFKDTTIRKRCRYSNDETADMIERAKKYAAEDMTHCKNVRVELIAD